MAYNNLQVFVQVWGQNGEQRRANYAGRAELQIAETADRLARDAQARAQS
jgi:hypothetical protein